MADYWIQTHSDFRRTGNPHLIKNGPEIRALFSGIQLFA
jgi:hypothetical protein